MRTCVITFPGSNCDWDVVRFFRDTLAQKTTLQWYQDRIDLEKNFDLVVIPGGFTYGDYLRAGAIAGRATVFEDVRRFAKSGRFVLGICNGFQILTESGMLPGALMNNSGGHFLCKTVELTAEKGRTEWVPKTLQGQKFIFPMAHAQGRFVADAETLKRLNGEGQVSWRYTEDVNGSMERIAGVCDTTGRVLGLMPHPERFEPDGKRWFQTWLSGARV